MARNNFRLAYHIDGLNRVSPFGLAYESEKKIFSFGVESQRSCMASHFSRRHLRKCSGVLACMVVWSGPHDYCHAAISDHRRDLNCCGVEDVPAELQGAV